MNIRIKILSFVSFISLLLFGIHALALKTNLYWTTSWIDIVTHTLGGVIFGAIFIYIFFAKNGSIKIGLKRLFISVFFVGVCWEIFELLVQFTDIQKDGFYLDTLGDLFFDVFGAYVAHLFLTETIHE